MLFACCLCSTAAQAGGWSDEQPVVGRIGNVMVGVRGAATTEPLRLWERVSADLERVANGKAARRDETQAAGGVTSG